MFFDVLTLSYLLPAALYTGLVVLRIGPPALRLTAKIIAASLCFVWLSLEVRHAFQGEYIAISLLGHRTSDGEWYAYSTAWLTLFGIGLALGLLRRDE